MSDYTTKATVELDVNGQKAKQELEQQRKLVKDLEIAYAKAEASGDKSAKTIHKELSRARRELKSMQSATVNAADVLRRLDKATPKELKATLKQLNKELNSIQRGTDAWNAHVDKIHAVKKELESVNSTLATQRTRWQKLGDFINKWQTMAVATFAVFMKIVSVGRSAVDAYASIDQEMANTQKFTGMAREEVESLNEEFKKMDTRTGREELNKLAQSAGRLGKDSVEDVLGFVRAGDKISVAMDELGEDAPEIISKLSGIFNLETEMGTEKAMLSTGSAVNTLSQVCAASAPNLVDFSSRFGAIASSSNMAMSEMLAFGAVLDSNGVTMEKGATAMQGVVTRMYAEPSKFAKIANLDAKEFTETLKRSSTEGLMMFIDRLSQMDQMQMSATLKELGTAGAGVTQTFQTLANKSEELKTRMQQSNKAFIEATSVDEEFAIQNNTVQAGLDKAKEKFRELQRELGEKLAPVMNHVISSTGAIVRVLIDVISFVDKYKGVIAVLTASILAYNIAVHASAIKTNALAVAQGIAKAATYAWTVVTQAAAVVTALFTRNLHKAKIEFKIFSALLKANPIGLFVASITAVVGGLALWITRTKQLTLAQEQLNDIEKKAHENSLDELTTLKLLYEASQDQKRSLEERISAIKQLQEKYPDYFGNLSAEAILAGNAADEYDRLTTSILNSARAKARQEQLVSNEREILRLEGERNQKLDEIYEDIDLNDQNIRFYGNSRQAKEMVIESIDTGDPMYQIWKRRIDAVRDYYDQKISDIRSANENLSKQVLDDMVGDDSDSGDDTTKKCPKCGKLPCVCYKVDDATVKDKFKAEKEWKEREEALNRITYATGQKSYEDYRKRIDEIAVEYYKNLMNHTEASADEQLQFKAQYYDALQKQQETNNAISLDAENARHLELVATEKQRYINGQTSLEAYNNAIALCDLEHKRRVVQIYQEGTQERLDAERDYQNALFQDMQRRNAETEAAEKKHQDQLAKMKSDYFGDNPSERQAKYDNDLKILTEVYNAELQAAGDNAAEKLRIEEAFEKAKLALKQKYGLLSVDENRNALEKANAELIKWLESDAGKAVTQSFDAVMSGMGAIFSQMSSLVQAELEIETAAIEKRYDKEISRAEGNTYKVKQLEEQKEREIAKAKNKANKKMFAMQVIQAVAQTAQNAINAYGSAAAIPVVGFVMAPIAAAMAVAAGMLQIAAIKKQQQASEAQGYASGGFTPKGGKYEPAGIVHKGEWVASQDLLASPVARPMIEALDYAQRTNTIGSLKADDVSRTISAPTIIASSNDGNAMSESLAAQAVALAGYVSVIRRLNERLDEPFVTVNTVTGDTGIKKAQDDYDKLIRNKTPKSKR